MLKYLVNKRLNKKDFIGISLSQITSTIKYRVTQKGNAYSILGRDYNPNRWNFKLDDNDIIISAYKG